MHAAVVRDVAVTELNAVLMRELCGGAEPGKIMDTCPAHRGDKVRSKDAGSPRRTLPPVRGHTSVSVLRLRVYIDCVGFTNL